MAIDKAGRPTTVQRAMIAVRRARAIELYVSGYKLKEITEIMGYSSDQVTQKDIKRGLESYVETQKQPIEELRARELATLDGALRVASEVMQREHVSVNSGEIVKDEDGNVIRDDGPN